MRVISLASGSSGNAMYVEVGPTALLLDAGIPAKYILARLQQSGINPGTLSGILLTHEHGDHTAGAAALAQLLDIPLIADPRTLTAVRKALRPEEATLPYSESPHEVGTRWQEGAMQISSFAVPHDAIANSGYLISSGGWTVCVVTDCGSMTEDILTHLQKANLIVLEANHDRERLLKGPYPHHLKKRILSPLGHLANNEAADALYRSIDDAHRWVWLIHLSKTNNTPDLARGAIEQRFGQRRLRTLHVDVAPPGIGPCWDSTAIFGQIGCSQSHG